MTGPVVMNLPDDRILASKYYFPIKESRTFQEMADQAGLGQEKQKLNLEHIVPEIMKGLKE